jgi:hypothetical protein
VILLFAKRIFLPRVIFNTHSPGRMSGGREEGGQRSKREEDGWVEGRRWRRVRG